MPLMPAAGEGVNDFSFLDPKEENPTLFTYYEYISAFYREGEANVTIIKMIGSR